LPPEIVLLVGPPSDTGWTQDKVLAALQAALPELGVKRASAQVATHSGWTKRDVYQLALSLK